MEDIVREKLLMAGVDMEDAMERFLGNENLLLKFLKKFPDDSNYEYFKKSMAEKNYDEAFKAVHTLKGLCGNLSLNNLYETVSREVELLRSENTDEAEEFMPVVVREYEKVFEILKTI